MQDPVVNRGQGLVFCRSLHEIGIFRRPLRLGIVHASAQRAIAVISGETV